eukprot:gene7408-5331_t
MKEFLSIVVAQYADDSLVGKCSQYLQSKAGDAAGEKHPTETGLVFREQSVDGSGSIVLHIGRTFVDDLLGDDSATALAALAIVGAVSGDSQHCEALFDFIVDCRGPLFDGDLHTSETPPLHLLRLWSTHDRLRAKMLHSSPSIATFLLDGWPSQVGSASSAEYMSLLGNFCLEPSVRSRVLAEGLPLIRSVLMQLSASFAPPSANVSMDDDPTAALGFLWNLSVEPLMQTLLLEAPTVVESLLTALELDDAASPVARQEACLGILRNVTGHETFRGRLRHDLVERLVAVCLRCLRRLSDAIATAAPTVDRDVAWAALLQCLVLLSHVVIDDDTGGVMVHVVRPQATLFAATLRHTCDALPLPLTRSAACRASEAQLNLRCVRLLLSLMAAALDASVAAHWHETCNELVDAWAHELLHFVLQATPAGADDWLLRVLTQPVPYAALSVWLNVTLFLSDGRSPPRRRHRSSSCSCSSDGSHGSDVFESDEAVVLGLSLQLFQSLTSLALQSLFHDRRGHVPSTRGPLCPTCRVPTVRGQWLRLLRLRVQLLATFATVAEATEAAATEAAAVSFRRLCPAELSTATFFVSVHRATRWTGAGDAAAVGGDRCRVDDALDAALFGGGDALDALLSLLRGLTQPRRDGDGRWADALLASGGGSLVVDCVALGGRRWAASLPLDRPRHSRLLADAIDVLHSLARHVEAAAAVAAQQQPPTRLRDAFVSGGGSGGRLLPLLTQLVADGDFAPATRQQATYLHGLFTALAASSSSDEDDGDSSSDSQSTTREVYAAERQQTPHDDDDHSSSQSSQSS